MKKLLISVSIVLFLSYGLGRHFAYAHHLPFDSARIIAQNYTHQHVKQVVEQDSDIYIFNLIPQGFIIISADDNAEPIIAYGKQDYKVIPNSGVNAYLEHVHATIKDIRRNHRVKTKKISDKWIALKAGNKVSISNALVTTAAIAPLLKTSWNQEPYYNEYCPENSSGQAVTGCVATAMAQIMKYWNFPASGNGSYSYSCPPYGTLSANFDSTLNWNLMSLNITASTPQDSINPDAELAYLCGISVAMQYSPSASGAEVFLDGTSPCAQLAYVQNWGYNANTLQGLQQSNYTSAQWDSIINVELNNQRPIEYVGYGSDGGHTYDIDGVQDDTLYHINWGWGGLDNGYYSLYNLNPSGIPLGSDNGMLIGIEPANLEPCSLPTNLVASGTNDTATTLTWLSGGNAKSYNLEYEETGASEWTVIIGITTNSYFLHGLLTGTNYQVAVQQSCNNNGGSGYTQPVSFTTLGTQECAIPQITKVFTLSYFSTIFFNPVVGAHGYIGKWRVTGTKTWNVTNFSAGSTQDTLKNLPASGTLDLDWQTVCSGGDTSLGTYYVPNYTWKSIFTLAPCVGVANIQNDSTGFDAHSVTFTPIPNGIYSEWIDCIANCGGENGYIETTQPITGSPAWISPNTQGIFAYDIMTNCPNGGEYTSPLHYFTTTDSMFIATPTSLVTSNITSAGATFSCGLAHNAQYYEFLVNNISDIITNPLVSVSGLTPNSSNFWLVLGGSQLRGLSSPSALTIFHTLSNNPPPPVCNVPTSVTVSSITTTSAIINYTGTSDSVYKIRYKTNAATLWDSIFTTNQSYQINNLTATTLYDIVVQSICSHINSSAFTSVTTFTTLTPPIVYCPVKGNTIDNYISKVQIGTFSNNTVDDNGYSLQTPVINLTAGSKYAITLTPTNLKGDYDEYWSVFIDYNHTGTFTEVWRGNSTVAVKGTLTISVTALTGATRMRIIKHANVVNSVYINNACQIGSYSDVQDYNVNILASATKLLGNVIN